MVATRFFPHRQENLDIRTVLEMTKSTSQFSPEILEKKINNVGASRYAEAQTLTFFNSRKYLEDLQSSKAEFCLVPKELVDLVPQHIHAIVVENTIFACVAIIQALFETTRQISHSLQPCEHYYKGKDVVIGQNCTIMPNVTLGDGVRIGDNCILESGVYIGNNCIIGNNCHLESNVNINYTEIGNNVIIHSGTSIGQDGYGFLPDGKGGILKIPQMDYVKIGNNVEIGANTCIDRGFVNPTVIGDYTKLDNLIHIAHGVTLGQGCFLTACVCIAGSTNVGNFVQMGGNTSVTGHIDIEDFVQIAGNSGVTKGIKKGTTVSGYPAVEIHLWRKTFAFINRLVKKNK